MSHVTEMYTYIVRTVHVFMVFLLWLAYELAFRSKCEINNTQICCANKFFRSGSLRQSVYPSLIRLYRTYGRYSLLRLIHYERKIIILFVFYIWIWCVTCEWVSEYEWIGVVSYDSIILIIINCVFYFVVNLKVFVPDWHVCYC